MPNHQSTQPTIQRHDLVDIGILRTTMMQMGDWVNGDLYNGKIVHVANSSVFKDPIYNYSGEFPFLWYEVTIPIRTESDHEYARRIFPKSSTMSRETSPRKHASTGK
jgi:small-conductance mechanosensitive channel